MLARVCPKGRKQKQTIDVQITVIKQSGYSDNLTALYIMNKMMEFYSAVLAYLTSEFDDVRDVEKIIALSLEAKPSWETTGESVTHLELCANRPSELNDDDDWLETTSDLIRAALRDLSVLKNPDAMELYHKIAEKCNPSAASDLFIWAREVKPRKDGSAVVILHVTDMERFRSLIERHDYVDNHTRTEGKLEDGVLIGS